MKRIVCALLAFALALSLCSCSLDNSDKTIQIGICFADIQNSPDPSYQKDLVAALEQAGYQITAVDSKNDQTRQTRQIAGFLNEKYALLLIEPVITDASGDIVTQLKNANTPAVFLNREPGADVLESWDRICYIGCDAIQPGILQGQLILDLPNQGDFNGDGIISYGIISGPENHVDAMLRTQYCANELSFGTLETTLLAVNHGDWTVESGQRICAQMLSQYGKDLEVLFCNHDTLALGAIQAIEAGGRTVGENLCLVGADPSPETLDLIANGKLTGTVSADTQVQLDRTVQAVQALLAGHPVEHLQYTSYTPITQENISQFLENP